MKKISSFIFALFFAIPMGIAAQLPPPSIPVPVTEAEIRDDSIKMRSSELERIKRDANKPHTNESSTEREIRFIKVKKDFENIQKLQDQIIKAYTTAKEIDYRQIGKSADEMRKNALRLHANLFGAAEKDKKAKEQEFDAQINVRNLIIELDNDIAEFVGSSIFNSNKVIDSNDSAKAQTILEKIIRLSQSLVVETDKVK